MPSPHRGSGQGARGGCREIIDAILCLLSLLLQVVSAKMSLNIMAYETEVTHLVEHPVLCLAFLEWPQSVA